MEFKRPFHFITFFILLTTLNSIVQGQDQNKYDKTYDLKYSLVKNSYFTLNNNSYYVEYKKKNNDVKKFQLSTFKMSLFYKVVDVTGEKISFQVEYKDRSREIFFKNEITRFDFTNLLGGKVKYSISSKGKVDNFADFEKLNTKFPNGGEESIDQLKEEIIHLLPALPDYPVRIGDRWKTSFGGDEEGFESFSVEYTLLDELKINGLDCLKIIANYTTENSYIVKSKGKSLHVEANSKGNDIYYFAYKKGFLLSRYSIGDGITNVYDSEKKLDQQRLSDVLYETKVIF